MICADDREKASFSSMEDTNVLHFSRSFSFSKKEILFIDNDAQSNVSRYVYAHLNDIKEICCACGYEFYFIPEKVRNTIAKMSDEQKRYYIPSGVEDDLSQEVGTDFMAQFCEEEYKQLVAPALFRFNPNNRCNAVKIFLLRPLDEISFKEQLQLYLCQIKAIDKQNEEVEKRVNRIQFSIGRPKDSIDIDLMVDSALDSDSVLADDEFDYETLKLVNEVRERIGLLRLKGVEEDFLHSLIDKRTKLSRMVITKDFRIFLPDYGEMEIVMSPLPKAVFLLFLRHEEGIPFKYLSDYRDELHQIYMQLTNRVQTFVIHKSLDDVCDPTKNAINEKCARIREAFVGKFDDCLARNYYITGNRGEAKRFTLPRNLVTWD